MIDDENEKRRNELCQRFRESLSRPVSERFFDEDELVDLFDFAGDLGDDYLKMEVLMCGARLYPDSDLLKQRRAIFYTFLSEDATSKFLDDNPGENSPIWEIMRLRSHAPQGDEARRALRYLVDGVDHLDDEEVIQLVELGSSLGVYDWLVDNEKLLRAKADYLPIFLYEMAVVSELNHNYNNAIRYLEELTEAEPFSAYYWFMLAQDYDMLDRHNDAMQALDYSLAVDSDNKDALQLRARLLMDDDDTRPQALEIVGYLAEKYPDDLEVQRAHAYINLIDGNVAAMRETMRRCLERFPGDRALLNDIMGTGLSDIPSVLDRFYANTEERDEATWQDWAEELKGNGLFDEACNVLEAYIRNSPEPLHDLTTYIDTLFFLQRFDQIVDIFRADTDDTLLSGPDRYSRLVIYIIALLKIGKSDVALQTVTDFLYNDVPEITSTPDLLQRISAIALLTEIHQRLSRKNHTDWNAFDPFGIWNNSNEESELPY